MDVSQPSFLLRQYINDFDYDDALSILDTFETLEDLCEIYTPLKDKKNCIHLIIDQISNEKSQKLLDKIIQITESFEQVQKLQESKLFQHALKSKHQGHFDYLLKKRINLLEKKAVSKCLDLIVKNNLIERCKTFLKNLEEKDLYWISNPTEKTKISPLVKAIEKSRISIFEIFISHLTRIKKGENKETIIFQPDQDGNTILHSISKIPERGHFFQKLLQIKILNSFSKEESEESLFNEVLAHLDDQNGNHKTPILVAYEQRNAKMFKKLLEYGAELTIPSSTDDKEFSQKEIPKHIDTSPFSTELLENAKYGLIQPVKGLPEGLLKIIQKRKEQGLLESCKDGKLEYAKKLIQNHNVNAKIQDNDKNSLPMIMLNHNVQEKIIIQFIDFLAHSKKIDFKHRNANEDNLLTFALTKCKSNVALQLVQKYLKKFDLDHKNNSQHTTLTLATNLENKQVLNVLLKDSTKLDMNNNAQGKKAIKILYNALTSQKNSFLNELKLHIKKLQSNLEKTEKEAQELRNIVNQYEKENTRLKQDLENSKEQLEKKQKTIKSLNVFLEKEKTILEVLQEEKRTEFPVPMKLNILNKKMKAEIVSDKDIQGMKNTAIIKEENTEKKEVSFSKSSKTFGPPIFDYGKLLQNVQLEELGIKNVNKKDS